MTNYRFTVVLEDGTLRSVTQAADTRDEALRKAHDAFSKRDQARIEWCCYEGQDAPDKKRETSGALWDACVVFPVWVARKLCGRG